MPVGGHAGGSTTKQSASRGLNLRLRVEQSTLVMVDALLERGTHSIVSMADSSDSATHDVG